MTLDDLSTDDAAPLLALLLKWSRAADDTRGYVACEIEEECARLGVSYVETMQAAQHALGWVMT